MMMMMMKSRNVVSGFSVRWLSVWSMNKDSDLESALVRNRRWTVNNEIKNMVLRYPDGRMAIEILQKNFRKLGLQGKAPNWIRKYPSCFTIDPQHSHFFMLSPRLADLVRQESDAQEQSLPDSARRLAKLLMMCPSRRLNAAKLNHLRRPLGLPDDFLLRVIPSRPDLFRVISLTDNQTRNSFEIELLRWDPSLAISAVQAQNPDNPRFKFCLPATWHRTLEKHLEFEESTRYISPYSECSPVSTPAVEKRAVGLLHELLSLFLWKKASIVKLAHFRRDFRLPDEDLGRLLMRHPGIFYVSNRYLIHTVMLREGYRGSDLVVKDPLVIVNDKFGELMMEGRFETNRRNCIANLEKMRRRGELLGRNRDRELRSKCDGDEEDEISDEERDKAEQSGLFDPEERKRFYKVLFEKD